MGEEGRARYRQRVRIRAETPEDYPEIDNIVRAAYGRVAEAALIDALRSDGAVQLALVAEWQQEIVGHVLLATLDAPFSACAMAPLAVAPLWQDQGIGTALVMAALEAHPCNAVFVRGAEEYFGRFGFSSAKAAGYACAFAGPSLLVRAADDVPPTGQLFYPQAFAALA
ncbi:GNAT family N-acetyltransferase [Falsirhodobacter sp. alg1]|uniref:GNAT family N-acetyltransferase n=1 Tax=Falsirhodobacter sp. alg1 TaxID=1472418 RepID=UPI0005EEE67E|nr:N-acetyltransferase [Falsirhodobacter sp. alg1]